MTAAIQIERLSKSYASRQRGMIHAVKHLSLTIESGDGLAVLGPNGAGKTTLLRLVGGLVRPDGGAMRILGYCMPGDRIHVQKRLGYLSADSGLYERLTVVEYLKYFAMLHGVPSSRLQHAIDGVLASLDLTSVAHAPAGTLSTGMKQRVAIARVVIHRPDVIILDEATRGLDIRMREVLLALLRDLQGAGATILYSTHHLQECETLCRRFLLLGEGEARLSGRIEPGWRSRVQRGIQELCRNARQSDDGGRG